MLTEVTQENGKTQCLILPIWEGKGLEPFVKNLDKKLDGQISNIIDTKDFEGKKSQTTLLYTKDKQIPRILLVGIGEYKNITIRKWKEAVGSSVLFCQSKKITSLSLMIPSALTKKIGAKKIGSETIVALELSNYSYDVHKEKDGRVSPIKKVALVGSFDQKIKTAMTRGMDDGQLIAESVNYARELGNVPPSVMTPTLLAEKSEDLARQYRNLRTRVLSLPEIERLGMGCLLGVARGSVEEPKFIILEYKNALKNQSPTVLVGKGITFDSGGLSLKPANYMTDMKFDMLGAATVLGTIKAAASLGLKKNIIGLIPTCENMPGGNSYRPDDILVSMGGKSVLIDNTDAEGRLILADALCYAKKYKPKEVIDFATLTGACMVALGNERSAVFSKEEKIVNKLIASSEESGEQLWRLPLGEEYSEAMKCEIADIKNSGQVGGRGHGGASTAAAFLQYFTDYPWAHIDLSCSYYGGKGKPYIRSGANGFGVQTMVEYLR